jgi:hypothetical protein
MPLEPLGSGARAQILATEHWSLLATRGTAQAEVLARITILLTFVSATTVSLALVGQATDFDERFDTFAIVLLCLLWLVGLMTLARVANASEEDMALVIGMNRLRAAYIEIDPDLAPYLVASRYDDMPGVLTTYNFFRALPLMHGLGSANALIVLVDSAVAGVLAAVVAGALGATSGWAVFAGVLVTPLLCAVLLWPAFNRFSRIQREYQPLFPTPAGMQPGVDQSGGER